MRQLHPLQFLPHHRELRRRRGVGESNDRGKLVGLGVAIDRDKLGKYAELFKSLGGYPYDRDPARPGWFSVVPNARWADPNDDRVVSY